MRRAPGLVVLLAIVAVAQSHAQTPTLVGSWTACGSTPLGRPWHVAVDGLGQVYVADMAQSRVFAFTPAGGFTAAWTCPDVAPLDFAPAGIAVTSAGLVYVTTPYPNGPAPFWVTRYTTAGGYMGTFGTMGSGLGELGRCYDVAADGAGNVYLTDWGNFRVDVLSSSGASVAQWGSYGSGPGQFHGPLAVAVDPAGLVYVTDDDNQRVEVFTSAGSFVRQWGSYGSGPGQFAGPWGIALDAAGNVFVADAGNNRIQVFTSTGEFVTQWGTLGSGPDQFQRPCGVAVGPDGRIYVADSWNSRVQVFAPIATPTETRHRSWGSLKATYR